ncbi:MAG: cytochrome c family protein [Cephaloticoccus sp.]|nr:cytochrome c family protein [Cephaloticoccus sp.]MCF7761919.1 cytochrome c family protein [Cephaloticoccus sp.]
MSKLFPKAANKLPLQIVIYLFVLGGIATAGVSYYMTPSYTRVGYAPVQPVPFSHAIHAGQLGLDCRYCHIGVDQGPVSTVPSAQTCMNCHNQIKTDSPLLTAVRESYETGKPVPWVKIHQVPDYVYFNHSAHINRGVSCVECHGRIDEMDTVAHAKPLSMGFCLDCHRNPEKVVRPLDKVTDLAWQHPDGVDGQMRDGAKFVHDWNIKPPQSCSGCHR